MEGRPDKNKLYIWMKLPLIKNSISPNLFISKHTFFFWKNSIIGDVLKHGNKLHFLSHFAIFNCLRMWFISTVEKHNYTIRNWHILCQKGHESSD